MAIDWLARRRHWTKPLGVGIMVSTAIQISIYIWDSRTHRSALCAAALFLMGLGLYFSTWVFRKIVRKNVVL